jgi:hypothetical protein
VAGRLCHLAATRTETNEEQGRTNRNSSSAQACVVIERTYHQAPLTITAGTNAVPPCSAPADTLALAG